MLADAVLYMMVRESVCDKGKNPECNKEILPDVLFNWTIGTLAYVFLGFF